MCRAAASGEGGVGVGGNVDSDVVAHVGRSWLNRIEDQFTALRYFALDGTDHDSHRSQADTIRRYIAWRNHPVTDPARRKVVHRAETINTGEGRPTRHKRCDEFAHSGDETAVDLQCAITWLAAGGRRWPLSVVLRTTCGLGGPVAWLARAALCQGGRRVRRASRSSSTRFWASCTRCRLSLSCSSPGGGPRSLGGVVQRDRGLVAAGHFTLTSLS